MALPRPCDDCQPLKLPWTEPSDFMDPTQAAIKLAENFKELERYSNYVIKNCLCCSCGGGEG